MDFIKNLLKRRENLTFFSICEKKAFYDFLISGDFEQFSQLFKKITELNVGSLKFTNVLIENSKKGVDFFSV